MVAMYNWGGFYLGANGGWGSSRKCWDMTNFVLVGPLNPNLPEGCHDATGGTVGGQIGYRWQASSWVFGLEAQGNWADFKGSNISNQLHRPQRNQGRCFRSFHRSGRLRLEQRAAVRQGRRRRHQRQVHRLYVSCNRHRRFDSANETRWGATVGVGLEYGFTPNWSFGVEYNHLFMGRPRHRR